MRPVDKCLPGETLTYDGVTITVNAEYKDYRDAKPALTANLGKMCSYCEKVFEDERDLHVEHIQPKNYENNSGIKIYKDLETKWSNFLLSCATCNGSDNKDTKNVIIGSCHLPHLNNTFLSLVYRPGGVVMVNPKLTGISHVNAENLLKLIGLDKGPKTSKPGDKRWRGRLEKWNLAEKYHNRYLNGKMDIDTIIDMAATSGHWSIWFTVFKGCDEVREALINAFHGTAAECFDPNNHYEPIPRNPGNNDPV